jgi:hypothetical protein
VVFPHCEPGKNDGVTGSGLSDFFHSTGFEVARNLVLFFVVVFWLGLAYWVYRDARRRLEDSWLIGTATAVGAVPFVGPVVYLLFRPAETIADQHVREVELRALESRLAKALPSCPVCRSSVEASFLVCPVCTTQLKEPCASCKAPLEQLWSICPYCATPVGAKLAAIDASSDLDTALTAEARAVPQRKRKPAAKSRRAAAS